LINLITNSATPSPVAQQKSALKTKKKEKKKKLTKADIGKPSSFQHVTHLGWSAGKGFDYNGEDESLRPFLQRAGVTETHLKNRETRKIIYDFIESNNVEAIVKNEKPPPLPARNPVNKLL
jgi:hypothetical protein